MSERFWASGHWQVKEGKAEEFIQQWKEWLARSSENVPGFHHARLLRSLNSPQQFTSISEWETAGARCVEGESCVPGGLRGIEGAL